jgi:hypothetical protein
MVQIFPKPTRKKTCLDMREFAFGKTNRKQRVNLKPRKERKHLRCIIPGCNKPVGPGRHHGIQKSDVIIDHELNLFDLCQEHHAMADEFEISQVDLFVLKAHETGISVEEILKTLSQVSGFLLYIDGDRVKVKKPVMRRTNHEQKAEEKEKAS